MRILLLLISCALYASAFAADEPLIQSVTSPDGSARFEARTWVNAGASKHQISVYRGGQRIFHKTLGPEKETRYVKASWSPDSKAVLVGLNMKAAEDLAVIQMHANSATLTLFDAGPLTGRMLDDLRFIEEEKNEAPTARVPWETVKWIGPTRCRMTYIRAGLGYRGRAELLVALGKKEPTMKVLALLPGVPPELWKQE